MPAARTSLRFVVGTALLTGGIAVAGGCSKPHVNTRPDVPPEQPPGEPSPGEGPIVNTRADDGPPADQPTPNEPLPDVNTRPDDPVPEPEPPHTVNIRTADPKPKPAPRPDQKPIINTRPDDKPSPAEEPPRVNTRPR